MKTKELIRQLQKEDPSGEVEVCVGNVDISFVHLEPAYWDGSLQVVTRDEKGYAIGGKYKRKGNKLQIEILSFSDLIWDHPEAKIDYSELDEDRQKSYKENHDKVRRDCLKLEGELELENFTGFIKEELAKLTDVTTDLKETAKEFYENNLSPKDEMPKDIPILNESWNSRRRIQWGRTIKVSYDGEIKIEKV
jgi:hypothetical protein